MEENAPLAEGGLGHRRQQQGEPAADLLLLQELPRGAVSHGEDGGVLGDLGEERARGDRVGGGGGGGRTREDDFDRRRRSRARRGFRRFRCRRRQRRRRRQIFDYFYRVRDADATIPQESLQRLERRQCIVSLPRNSVGDAFRRVLLTTRRHWVSSRRLPCFFLLPNFLSFVFHFFFFSNTFFFCFEI